MGFLAKFICVDSDLGFILCLFGHDKKPMLASAEIFAYNFGLHRVRL